MPRVQPAQLLARQLLQSPPQKAGSGFWSVWGLGSRASDLWPQILNFKHGIFQKPATSEGYKSQTMLPVQGQDLGGLGFRV